MTMPGRREQLMLSLDNHFEELRKSIEPAKKYKDAAKKADDPVREHLETHESFAERHITTFLYGSYKRNTSVGNIKDVDLVVVTDYTTNDDPVDVLDDLKESLTNLYSEPELADQRRSIRIDQPLPDDPDSELTLDVIPAIYQGAANEPLWVPDRDKECWVASHPLGHIEYTSDLNARSHNGVMFVRLAKMMRWWWKYQFECSYSNVEGHKRKPKGFWIEVMAGQYTDLSKQSYPALILSLLENAFAAFKSFRTTGDIPVLKDPGLPGQTIKTSMADDEFSFFLDTLEESLEWVRLACETTSEERAVEHWIKVFGDTFQPPSDKTSSALLSPAATPGGLAFPPKPVVPRKPGGFA
jgi:hypothetical protein